MGSDEARRAAAVAMRNLIHEFAGRDPDDDALFALAARIDEETARLRAHERRDRMALMAKARLDGSIMGGPGSGFDDRAVGGQTNPTGVDVEIVGDFEDPDSDVVAQVTLRRAFEGAPGRAHGGIVAAAFDDVTGFVIGQLREPAFTGELTIRYVAPVPVDEPLEMRARLEGRERRKLFITGEAKAGDTVVATCRAIYVTVDPARFAGAPDPR